MVVIIGFVVKLWFGWCWSCESGCLVILKSRSGVWGKMKLLLKNVVLNFGFGENCCFRF